MERLSHIEIGELLQPYLTAPAETQLCEQISRYLELLAHWSRRMSLTSVRNGTQIVQRHFGESLFLAERLPSAATFLDLGSGAGFPGIPVALVYPGLEVTLAESQGKKAAFLREAVSELKLSATVWADRVERMPASRLFDIVALRAVDRMEAALELAAKRMKSGGTLAFFAGQSTPDVLQGSWVIREFVLPRSVGRLVVASHRESHA